jgi:peptidoglycan-associated lipoprotein
MNSIDHPSRSVRRVAPAGVVLLLVASCARHPQAQAATAGGTGAGRASMQGSLETQAPPDSGTAATIAIAPEIRRACNIPDSNSYFPFDSSHLTTYDRGPLDALANCFTRGAMTGRRMHLIGRADPRGPTEYNLALGQARADAVAGYLDDRGLRPAQITTSSRGSMDATGTNEGGWAYDRRVDVTLAR